MKTFVVFGNCQTWPLARTMLENKEFASRYRWEKIPWVQDINEGHVAEVLEKVSNADLFLYQPVAPKPASRPKAKRSFLRKLLRRTRRPEALLKPQIASSGRPREIDSIFLNEQLKDGAISISFPSAYFDGYFPHLQTLNGMVATLNLVHDYFIVYAYVIGLTEKEILSLMQRDDLYPRQASVDLALKSLENLRSREEKNKIDVRLSDFIANNYKARKLFNQFNHPKREVFRYLAESILAKIGIEHARLDDSGASHLDMIMTPVYRSTYNNLELAFAEDFITYNAKGNLQLTQEEVVHGFFDFYRQADTAELKQMVFQNKPFVPEILEAHL